VHVGHAHAEQRRQRARGGRDALRRRPASRRRWLAEQRHERLVDDDVAPLDGRRQHLRRGRRGCRRGARAARPCGSAPQRLRGQHGRVDALELDQPAAEQAEHEQRDQQRDLQPPVGLPTRGGGRNVRAARRQPSPRRGLRRRGGAAPTERRRAPPPLPRRLCAARFAGPTAAPRARLPGAAWRGVALLGAAGRRRRLGAALAPLAGLRRDRRGCRRAGFGRACFAGAAGRPLRPAAAPACCRGRRPCRRRPDRRLRAVRAGVTASGRAPCLRRVRRGRSLRPPGAALRRDVAASASGFGGAFASAGLPRTLPLGSSTNAVFGAGTMPRSRRARPAAAAPRGLDLLLQRLLPLGELVLLGLGVGELVRAAAQAMLSTAA
jgi:hypothetical protein